MMFVAVVPVTWKIGPGATIVAADAVANETPWNRFGAKCLKGRNLGSEIREIGNKTSHYVG